MSITYTNISSPNFISQIKYHRIKLYSLQRGDEYLLLHQTLVKEYDRLKRVIKRVEQTGHHISPNDVGRFEELKKQVGKTQLLINENGAFHSSAQLTHTFNADDAVAREIDAILLNPTNNVPDWMCAPVFRDAIVYYDEAHTIIACLNICFSCERMMLNESTYVDAGASVYVMLKKLLISQGHRIVNE